MYEHFSLVLAVTRQCNLRCCYCYAGAKRREHLPLAAAQKGIDRALASVRPGGDLNLGFFGGEALLEAPLVASLMAYARAQAAPRNVRVGFSLTTNGTVTTPTAWQIMTDPDLDLAVSHDGVPEVQDRQRPFRNGQGTSAQVVATIGRLVAAGVKVHVIMVARPDNLGSVIPGIEFVHELGVRSVDPALDLWTRWTARDMTRLERVVTAAARLWQQYLPNFGINWFDEKFALLTNLKVSACARCGFGQGELAVAPSGRLYPCERLIGDDQPGNPVALPGQVLDGEDFLHVVPGVEPTFAPPCRVGGRCLACAACQLRHLCNTFCSCSNYVRSGNRDEPDRLLCRWNKVCIRETSRAVREMQDAQGNLLLPAPKVGADRRAATAGTQVSVTPNQE